jgi:hypothetical protein
LDSKTQIEKILTIMKTMHQSFLLRLCVIIISVPICFVYHSHGQDVLVKKSGEEIEVIVIEVGIQEIRYKHFDNLQGPDYVAQKSEIALIRYENKTEERFTPTENLIVKGENDAMNHYRGYNGAGTGTLAVSLLSPLVGLIPALACSSTPPKDKNLMYPDPYLMDDRLYATSYKNRARKMKSNKVWTNWGIGFGVNVILFIALTSGN